jgi:hypothetical protein
VEYLVKWVGWSVEEATWETGDNLDNCKDILKRFLEAHPKGNFFL